MQDASHVALLDALQGQGSNQSSTNTRTILSSQNLDRVLVVLVGLGGPVKDLAEGLSTTGLEVRVLVEDRAISSNMTGLEVLLLADGSYTTSRESSGAGADQLGSSADELKLGSVGAKVQLVQEEIKSLLEVLKWVTNVNVSMCRGMNKGNTGKEQTQERNRNQNQKWVPEWALEWAQN